MLTKQKMTAKDPKEKLAFQRLTILQLAEHLGSISEACRRSGMNRTSFYEWKRRFQTLGFKVDQTNGFIKIFERYWTNFFASF